MARRGLSPALCGALACALAGAALASSAAAAGPVKFHPRVKNALGLFPTFSAIANHDQDLASGAQIPATYHGGTVMSAGITVHTIFWAPSGTSYPAADENLVKQFFTDVAAGSGDAGTSCAAGDCNTFSTLNQYGQGTSPGGLAPGAYSISYSAASDSIDDRTPYPTAGDCASPNGTITCVTDAQVQAEIQRDGANTGLHDLWYVFLPPNVDECITVGVCGTNAFGGYHSLSHVGNGATIYAITPHPSIEVRIPRGTDPNGLPDGDAILDVAAHETVEAMTDPEGVGWMDPNGFEVGDKCENGPQDGTYLGYTGPDNSPYNQVLDGHAYLLQEMWSNADNGCVQNTAKTANPLPLPQVNLTQFSRTVSGNIGHGAADVRVTVKLARSSDEFGDPVTVSQASTSTAGDGSWSVQLSHAVGDDRDEIDIAYSGAGSPANDAILTGNGGNPFTESGWTGWTAMDNGTVLSAGSRSLTVGPCFQNGVFAETQDGAGLPSATDYCNTASDTATIPLSGTVWRGTAITISANDNRGFDDPNLPGGGNGNGALVKLTVGAGEPDSVSQFVNPTGTFQPTGFPTCAADLEGQAVTCAGLVPSRRYRANDGRRRASGTADDTGTVTVQLAARRGDKLTLSNGVRTLTTLHVAHLRVDITGEQSVVSAGSCEPDQYYAPPLSAAPTSDAAGDPTFAVGGAALTDQVCPANGDATGLSASSIIQTDESSGGATQTEVPDILNTSPMQGETVYGSFVALAQSGLTNPDGSIIPTDSNSRIGLSVFRASGGRPVFSASNVDTRKGVRVSGLRPGNYNATWVLHDANGDTRTVSTRFIEQPGVGSSGGSHRAGAQIDCSRLRQGHEVRCQVGFAGGAAGALAMRLSSGGTLALGSGRVRHGAATITLRSRRALAAGSYSITLVLRPTRGRVQTIRETVRLR